MKKLHVLIPSLVALSAAPLISLVGCGPDTPIEDVTFSTSTKTISSTVANVNLDWEPSETSIIFTGVPTATCGTISISEAKFIGESRPQKIELTFSGNIDQDLEDVSIEFDYTNKTKKIDGHSKIDGIHIDKYDPDKPMEIEWDYAKNGEYTATQTKTDVHPMTQEKAFIAYLTDIKDNPKILIEDILNTENSEYWQLLHIYRADIETYTVKYEIIDFDSDKSLVSLKIDRSISYTYFTEPIKIETHLTLTNIQYTSVYSMSHKDGKVFNCWSFAPVYYGCGVDDFIQCMVNLQTDWVINGTISFPSTEPEVELKFDNWKADKISEAGVVTDKHLQFLNQEYYGIDNSYYYSQCPIAPNKSFDWIGDSYQIKIDQGDKKQYFGCDFAAEGFESGDYSIEVKDKNGIKIQNLDINCNINGNFKSLHTNINGIAEIGLIEENDNLILHIVNWPSSAESLQITIVKK